MRHTHVDRLPNHHESSAERLRIFYDDGAWVNGYCDKGGDEYDIEYEGLSKREAIDWVITYCRY